MQSQSFFLSQTSYLVAIRNNCQFRYCCCKYFPFISLAYITLVLVLLNNNYQGSVNMNSMLKAVHPRNEPFNAIVAVHHCSLIDFKQYSLKPFPCASFLLISELSRFWTECSTSSCVFHYTCPWMNLRCPMTLCSPYFKDIQALHLLTRSGAHFQYYQKSPSLQLPFQISSQEIRTKPFLKHPLKPSSIIQNNHCSKFLIPPSHHMLFHPCC